MEQFGFIMGLLDPDGMADSVDPDCSSFRSSQGPVVQSIVSLTSSLSGQLVKCFKTLLPNTLIFFQQKIMAYLRN